MAQAGLDESAGTGRGARHGARWGAGLAVTAALLAALAGCAGTGSDSGGAVADGGVTAPLPAERPAADGSDQGTLVDGVAGGQYLPADRSVIATASLTIRVDDVVQTLPRLTGIASANGGYVAGEDSATDPEDPTHTTAVMVLRVPTARMGAVLNQVDDLGDVLSRQQDVQDVTQQVVDVDSRVASARASVARIRVLLDRAESISDIVRIESELSRREADLESLLAQQRSLHDQTELATVTVTLVGADTPAPTDEQTGFLVGLEKGWHAFTTAVAWALTVVGALLPFLVLALVVAVPIVWVWRRQRRSSGTSPRTDVHPPVA
jgi:glycine cleavage system regulatory protein